MRRPVNPVAPSTTMSGIGVEAREEVRRKDAGHAQLRATLLTEGPVMSAMNNI
jgi:hypothetical protein